MLTGRRSCGAVAAPRAGGILAAQTEGGRPAARAAAAPPRSRLRREIRGDERCSLMAGVLLTIGWAGGWLAPRVLACATASAAPGRPGTGAGAAVRGRNAGLRRRGAGRG